MQYSIAAITTLQLIGEFRENRVSLRRVAPFDNLSKLGDMTGSYSMNRKQDATG